MESYRSIGFCELVFHKRKSDFWLIVGENNSGKTTILKAMDILLNNRPEIKTHNLHDYNPSENWRGKNQKLQLSACVQTRTGTWTLESEWRLTFDRLERVRQQMPESFEGGFILIEPKDEAYVHHLTKTDGKQDLRVVHLLERQLKQFGSYEDKLKHLEQYLKHSLYSVSAVRNIRIDPESLMISVDDGTLAPVTGKAPGLQKFVILSIIEWLNRQENSVLQSYVLGFDEPESHLHPQSVKSIARRIRQLASQGLQVFCTSHSPYFVYQAGVGNTIRIINQYQSAVFFGLPVSRISRDNDRYDYSKKITISANIGRVFTDRLTEEFLKRPLLQNEKTLNALFSGFTLLVEGESEEIYIPLLYTIWRKHYFAEWLQRNGDRIGMHPDEAVDRVPYYLDELDIHLVPFQGKFALYEFLFLFTLFNIRYHILLDNDTRKDRNGNDVSSNRKYISIVSLQKGLQELILGDTKLEIRFPIDNSAAYDELARRLYGRRTDCRELTIYYSDRPVKYEVEDFVIRLIGWDNFRAFSGRKTGRN
jgi:energy-coupling factor transporter ATP-binding protein EcfA2